MFTGEEVDPQAPSEGPAMHQFDLPSQVSVSFVSQLYMCERDHIQRSSAHLDHFFGALSLQMQRFARRALESLPRAKRGARAGFESVRR